MANTVWGIHTMNDNLFLNNNVIAIGWKAFGDLSVLDATREAFKAHYEKSYPDAKKGSIPQFHLGGGLLPPLISCVCYHLLEQDRGYE